MTGVLRVVFWNALARDRGVLSSLGESDTVLIAEPMEEATYAPHHRQKLAFQLAGLRRLKADLEGRGVRVAHYPIDEASTPDNWTECVRRAVQTVEPDRLHVSEPPDWRLQETVDGWARAFNRPVEVVEDETFFLTRDAFAAWADGRSGRMLMESFYRELRRRTGVLMDGDKPVGGRWNFDAENRKRLPSDVVPPDVPTFAPGTVEKEALRIVDELFPSGFGALDGFNWPVTPEQASNALDDFIARRLPQFGDYQDALAEGEDTLFHSLLSTALNHGLLTPRAVCEAAEAAYRSGDAPLAATEGFIRQILGWREYVRGIYWLRMPDYKETNAFGHDRDLPSFYWTGDTPMRCVAEAVRNTRDNAYAHHIQRLMITGNFALLAGVAPRDVNAWYLGVYADAFEWVQLPNTHGMSQFADGGYLATKPYVSGGAYINKMGNYCRTCRYDVKEKTGENACPFNYLYWNFLERHESSLKGLGRLNQVYATLGKMSPERRAAIRKSAAAFLDGLDERKTAA